MALQKFRFESIGDIEGGSVAVGINQALRAAFLDCSDRPELDSARKVTLEISVKPVMDHGQFAYAAVTMGIKSANPGKAIEVRMRAADDGLEFQPLISNNPDQVPLPFNDRE